MYFEIERNIQALPQTVSAFIAIVGWNSWQERIRQLRETMGHGHLLRDYVLERHSLELTLDDIVSYRRTRGRLPKDVRSVDEYKLFSFMFTVVNVYNRLSSLDQNELEGRFRHALQDVNGFIPLQHEMETIAHLMSKEFAVDLMDSKADGGFDFLATKLDVEIEVECKTFSADVGRQIHRRRMIELSEHHLLPMLHKSANQLSGGRFLRITLSGKLTGRPEFHARIAEAVKSALLSDAPCNSSNGFTVSSEPFDLLGTLFAKSDPSKMNKFQLHQFVEEQWHESDKELLFCFNPGKCAIVLLAKSEKQDTIIDGIYRRLKRSAMDQFTKLRPAILIIRLSDLTPGQMQELIQSQSDSPNNLQRIASRLFRNPDRGHIHTIAFVSVGGAEQSTHTAGDTITHITTESGPSYVFRNPNHPMATDPDYAVFSRAT